MFPHSPARQAITLRIALAALLAVLLTLGFPLSPGKSSPAEPVVLLTVNGPIGPAYSDYITRGIERANETNAELVVLRIDTPGGLDTSMREIIRAILTSPVPVACYVAPSGARAASAGTYILFACHIAAMAPGTNIGAATPIEVGPSGPVSPEKEPATPGTMHQKAVNDAAAYIRGLAQLRGRNAEWAERAVREAVSLPAEEALKANVVDVVAPDLPGLLKQSQGRKVSVLGQERVLQTANATVLDEGPDWRTRLLAAITNPSVALILMTIGIYGMIFEFMSPGAVAPGVIGAICVLLGLYGLQLLPINYSGLALIFLGIAFMIAEAFLPTFGAIGFGGVIAFVIGALMLMETDQPGFGIPPVLIATVGIVAAVVVAATVQVALRSRRRKSVTGLDTLVGSVAEMLDDAPREGWANVGGETWRVVSKTPLVRGQKVRVVGRRGSVLEVAPFENQAQGA